MRYIDWILLSRSVAIGINELLCVFNVYVYAYTFRNIVICYIQVYNKKNNENCETHRQ